LIDADMLTPLIDRWGRRSPLAPSDLSALVSLAWIRRSYPKDAYLVREGVETAECALLLSGFAYRQKLVRHGARQIVSIHIPGEFVDLQDCLLGIPDHNVQTLNNAEIALVAKKSLLDLAAGHPAIGQAMWLDTLIDSSIFREWVVNVGRRDARSRIAHLLCEMALRLDAVGMRREDGYAFPLTQEQLADATGLTPVHTNRVLQGLRKDGLISLGSHALTVLDWGRLRDVGDFDERYLHHAA